MSQNARLDEETATQRRASILGLPYIDASKILNKQLYKNLLSNTELYNLKTIPIVADEHNISFGITNTTSQQTMKALANRFQDQRLTFSLISDTGYHDYMELYDPPKAVVYQDIALNQDGNQDLLKTVSATLEQVKADDILAYLVQQAHRLNAS